MAVKCQVQVTAVILISMTSKVMYCYLILVMTGLWIMVLTWLTLIFCGKTWAIAFDIKKLYWHKWAWRWYWGSDQHCRYKRTVFCKDIVQVIVNETNHNIQQFRNCRGSVSSKRSGLMGGSSWQQKKCIFYGYFSIFWVSYRSSVWDCLS
jgi:hypothetical protein